MKTRVIIADEHDCTNVLTEPVKKEAGQKTPFEMLEEAGLIGSIDGEETLSMNYKKELGKSLATRFP